MPEPSTAMLAMGAISAVAGASASSRAARSDRNAMRFQQQRYDDWKAIYGPIEENLSEYYNNLTPERITAQGLQAQQQEFQKAEVSIRESIAQRGLEQSGIEASAETNLAIQSALAKAKVRADAPEEVARQQQSFLQSGEARRQGAERGIAGQIDAQGRRQSAAAQGRFQAAGSLLAMGISNLPDSPPPELRT